MSILTIDLLSDWHIGSGTGRPGSIDRLVKRDRDGLPYIPAKTLTGMWRDGCETVAYGLDQGSSGTWTQWVTALFGDQPALQKGAIEQVPQAALLSVRAAHLPIVLRSQLQAKPLLKEALSFVKPGVKISAQSGSAEPQCLRFEEMVRGGMQLQAEYHLHASHLSSKQVRLAEALLTAGAALVQRLGAKRRRGSGQCKLQLEMALSEAIAHLEGYSTEPMPAPTRPDRESFHFQLMPLIEVPLIEVPLIEVPLIEALVETDWCCVDLILTTQSPLILHKQTIGNLVETLDYIPGTYLLPIIRRKLADTGMNVHTAIAQNHLVITNATPEIDRQRGQPIPLALFQEKLNPKQIYNRLGEAIDAEAATPQLKGIRSGYVSNTASLQSLSPRKVVETHNTVSDTVQRPNEEVGGIYTYAAIDAGQRFRAIVSVRQSLLAEVGIADATQLAAVLAPSTVQNTMRLGRAKKDDYGFVFYHAQATHTEAELMKPNPAATTLTIWLLADTLLRDRRLRPTTDPQVLVDVLATKLNVSLALDPDDRMLDAITRQQRTESWQTQWGLPRPSLVGLSAGSCFQVQVTQGRINPEQLRELERTGIGERTVEGYGQLCFNSPLLRLPQVELGEAVLGSDSIDNCSINTDSPNTDSPNADSPDHTIYDTTYNTIDIEQAAWRSAIQRTALALAASRVARNKILGIDLKQTNGKWESIPRMSQLAMLRSLLKQLQPGTPEHPQSIIQWIDAVHAIRSDRWKPKSLDKIKALLTQREVVWQQLVEGGFEPERLTLSSRDEALQRSLWVEAVRTLVEACLRAQKRDCE